MNTKRDYNLQKYQSAAIISKRVNELYTEESEPLLSVDELEKHGLYDEYSVAKHEFENGLLSYNVKLKPPVNSE